jgi:hypothetical protein
MIIATPIVAISQQLEYVGSAFWSGANDIEVAGDYAYCAYANGLVILDVSDPTFPTLCSQRYCYGEGKRIGVSGNYAYLADGPGGLRVFNIANVFSPTEIGHLQTIGSAVDVYIQGNYAYVADDSMGLFVVNVCSPSNPIMVGAFAMPDGYGASALTIADTFACVTSSNKLNDVNPDGCIYIINVNDPLNPFELRSFHLTESATSIVVSGDYIYVTFAAAEIMNGGSRVFNILNPSWEYSTSIISSNSYEIVVTNDYAFVATECGIWVMRNYSPPGQLPQYEPVGVYGNERFDAVKVVNGLAYLGNKAGIKIIECSNPESISLVGSHDNDYSVSDVAILNNYAYVGSSQQFYILNVTNPSNPVSVGWCNLSSPPVKVAVSGQYAYATCGVGGLRVIDVSQQENPAIVGSFITGERLGDMKIVGSLIYVCDQQAGLKIVDAVNPTDPHQIGIYQTENNTAGSVDIHGSMAYLACHRGLGLRSLNISNPSDPVFLGGCESGAGHEISISGICAYLAIPGYLQIFNIADNLEPINIANFPVDAFSIDIAGNFVFAGGYKAGLTVIDVSDPIHPVEASKYYLPGRIENVHASGDLIYVANEYSMIILRTVSTGADEVDAIPLAVSLFPAYPNPFNSSTSIAYELPRSSSATIRFFDILGREVGIINEGFQNAGRHQAIWRAERLASGIYFARMESDCGVSEPIRLLLLR